MHSTGIVHRDLKVNYNIPDSLKHFPLIIYLLIKKARKPSIREQNGRIEDNDK